MAKKEQRILFAFVCTVCKSQNYITSKNKLNIPEKLSLNKYCKMCKKHTKHKESSKLD
ncbi:50S ribosomal protein L33 [Candidatus Gottesmanbacteria bacterium CG11_big_fil_rev_8_21_14_0_20_37_11]|uniref:Large ribosomal subunit protein bL33 n=1 Tax=Candidatus Gottesmanbacteria bacterium CG11_big_fil_rev_8_21_14_0_20_37_11 TaxID=1974575 RepID=A0A2H0NI78_9BACT|nr:MAG: 50S ribosomal protein L33 [Candidatus Gottesmanbacteria bacterium CG11_big_fil_rev_8_21_14_0_20_37_11]